MNLPDRMKAYEAVSAHALTRRMPAIIRVDGRAFHTLTRGLDKPFDVAFQSWMADTAAVLCEEAQGCKLAYVQSDEISLLLTDYDTLQTQPWFDYSLSKLVSIAASVATAAFNTASGKRGTFDARAFSVPREEVANYFAWRQQDATRNSIQGYGQALLGHKRCHGLTCDQIQEALWQERQMNWNDAPTVNKRGMCVLREAFEFQGATRHAWQADLETPIFTQDRAYIERHLYPETATATLEETR